MFCILQKKLIIDAEVDILQLIWFGRELSIVNIILEWFNWFSFPVRHPSISLTNNGLMSHNLYQTNLKEIGNKML